MPRARRPREPALLFAAARGKIALTMARKDKEERAEMRAEHSEEESAEPRVYELGFHIDPELSQEKIREVFQGIKDAAGKVVAVGEPEKIPLAYVISRMERTGRRDFSTAFFAWVAYEASPEEHAKVVESARDNEHIIRFIDIHTTKEAALHAAEQREMRARLAAEKLKNAEEPTEEEGEDVSEEELDAALEETPA